MAAMTTVLTEFANNGNSRTSTLSGHTAAKPRLVIEKRRVPEGNQTVPEYSFKVIYTTTDADGITISSKIAFEFLVRYPTLAQSADIDAALVIFRDIIAGDEVANSITTQEWLT